MAGPYKLAPNAIQYEIPTMGFGDITVVEVDANVAGVVEMTAGASPSERDTVVRGRNSFNRNFGGVLLAIKNLTPGEITVTTRP
jgi:hypothetical protein